MTASIKLVLVNVWKLPTSTPHFGLTSLAAYLFIQTPQIKVEIIEGFNPTKKIISAAPDIIGFTSDTLTYNKTKKIANIIKSRLFIPLILGGVHVTALPQSFSQPFDIGVIGEGEITLTELIKHYLKYHRFNPLFLSTIDGLVYQKGRSKIITKPRSLIANIDELPFPAREITPMEEIYLRRQTNPYGIKRMATVMTSRGCPYHCLFCGSPAQWGRVRFHSPEYVIKEIKYLVDRYQIDGLMFWDDLFITPLTRLTKIKDLFLQNGLNHKLKIIGYARANLITPESCQILQQMNVKRLIFGLESGSPEILNYLKQNSVTVEDNRRAVTLCRQYGITTSSGYIVGTPGETIADLQMTYNFMKKYPLDNTQIYILTPYPGTKIWPIAIKHRLVSVKMNFSRLFVQLPGLKLIDFLRCDYQVLRHRIFLNSQFKRNNQYLKLIHRIRLLAYWQNTAFYLKTVIRHPFLLKQILFPHD